MSFSSFFLMILKLHSMVLYNTKSNESGKKTVTFPGSAAVNATVSTCLLSVSSEWHLPTNGSLSAEHRNIVGNFR